MHGITFISAGRQVDEATVRILVLVAAALWQQEKPRKTFKTATAVGWMTTSFESERFVGLTGIAFQSNFSTPNTPAADFNFIVIEELLEQESGMLSAAEIKMLNLK
jgi:hypothetical protein